MSDGDSAGRSPWPIDRRAYRYRLRKRLPSDRSAINGAVEDVLRIAERCDCREDARADLEIAVREALANAIIHGNEHGHAKTVFLRCYGAPSGELLIAVRDEGEGFDPGEVPDPRGEDRLHLHHGRGLFLMRALIDHIEYRRGGCEVVLYKVCPP